MYKAEFLYFEEKHVIVKMEIKKAPSDFPE